MKSNTRQPLQGVNLGGWLVLEKWITPSLFAGTDAADEYGYCRQASTVERLKTHRKTFITEADFRWLARHGVQVLRVPVGYWAFGDCPPFASTVDYIDKAFAWANKHGLRILLDVHGAPGSQNGEDHSGHQGRVQWAKNPAHITQTLQFINRLTQRYGGTKAWLGIELLNEPNRHLPGRLLQRFYKQAYHQVRSQSPKAWVVISDSFQPWRWYMLLPRRSYPGLYMDYHHYQLFTPQDKLMSPMLHITRARTALRRKIKRMTRFHPSIVGEWSLALPAGQLTNTSASERAAIAKQYATAQLQSYQPLAAWFFWTYKTETAHDWDYRYNVQNGNLQQAAYNAFIVL